MKKQQDLHKRMFLPNKTLTATFSLPTKPRNGIFIGKQAYNVFLFLQPGVDYVWTRHDRIIGDSRHRATNFRA